MDNLHDSSEPVAWDNCRSENQCRSWCGNSACASHWDDAPPQPSKPWVGLTEEEAEDIWNRYCDEMGKASINDAPDITRAIEAKLREKNA